MSIKPESSLLLLERIFQFSGNSPLINIQHQWTQDPIPLIRWIVEKARSVGYQIVHLHIEAECADLFKSGDIEFNIEVGSHLKMLPVILNGIANKSQNDLIPFITSLLTISKETVLLLPNCYNLDDSEDWLSRQRALSHFSTTILTIESLEHKCADVEAQKQAKLSLKDTEQTKDGIITPMGCHDQNLYIVCKYLRKSGRMIHEDCVLLNNEIKRVSAVEALRKEESADDSIDSKSEDDSQSIIEGVTFNLSMSEDQRKLRENLKLPFTKAQNTDNDDGIYYVYDKEDNFDEDEPDDEDELY